MAGRPQQAIHQSTFMNEMNKSINEQSGIDLFVSEMKWELIEWLPGSSLIDFINGCEQLVIGLTPEQLKSTLSFISLYSLSLINQLFYSLFVHEQ